MGETQSMIAGVNQRTVNHNLTCYWPTLGDKRDGNFSGEVLLWIGKNERALNKLTASACVQQLREQFPTLCAVESRHANGPIARSEG